ncbi:hypothetical protein GOP47_0015761 [Adiantum capillus-veneris]|uniref:peptidyl-tRNA hydrolase n=1 Tax=Adiantum capillus-veneris TaxID=13818 RepID=A0A9D4ZDI3_ADICA|nr:hypothetical protein GOP47_0015761 [Adiantum capillus-veneris]
MLRRAQARLSTALLPGGTRQLCNYGVEDEQLKKAPWLFVGVGNPGPKFLGTRHNVGFEMIDAVSESAGITLSTIQHRAILGEGTIKDSPVVLAKPQTYANLIGDSIAPLMEQYCVPAEKILVILDDMDTRISKLQLVSKGGHGNHRGLMNLIAYLKGNRNFPRLRIGIGLPPEKMDPKAFVLQRFCEPERKLVEKSITQGVEIIRLVAANGVEKTMDSIKREKMAS